MYFLLKGFLGGGANKSKPKKATKKEQKEGEIPTITAKQGAGKGKSGVVLDDVQKAMKEEEERNPLLQNLKNGGWFLVYCCILYLVSSLDICRLGR